LQINGNFLNITQNSAVLAQTPPFKGGVWAGIALFLCRINATVAVEGLETSRLTTHHSNPICLQTYILSVVTILRICNY